jgi:glutamate synthase (NADPH/NADH) small chain
MHRLAVDTAFSSSVIDALDFIAGYKTGARLEVAPRVVVVGAGNTAIDAACAAKRLGAQSVTILYRRRRENISAFDSEYDHAIREGIVFRWETLPTAFAKTGHGIALTCVAMAQDAAGAAVPVEDSEFTIDCDVVIPAIGQSPLLDLLSHARGVTIERGRVLIDRATGQTTNPKFFAGGDCVNGGREVVDAVADGKRAARGIAAWLSGYAKMPRGRTEENVG